MALTTLALLSETEKVPGYRPLLRSLRGFAQEWEADFWRNWRQPQAAWLRSLVARTFSSDLEVERARAEWRKAAGLKADRGRFVRGEWRKRILGLRSLGDEEKQRLASSLRARAVFEVEERGGGMEAFLAAIEAPEAAVGRFRAEFVVRFGGAMERAADSVALEVGIGPDWALANPEAVDSLQAYAGYYGDRFTRLVPMEWQTDIQKAVIRGLDEGQGIPEMRESVQAVWDNLRGFEAERIARTEAVRARAEAKEDFYQALGLQEIEWVVGPNPCTEICLPRAGRRFPASQRGLQPAHPNCECDWVATDEDIDRFREQALAGTGPAMAWPETPGPRYLQAGAA